MYIGTQPLSAADYLELCRNFDTLFLRDIPKMTTETLAEARRFITLIDTLYDRKVSLIPPFIFSLEPRPSSPRFYLAALEIKSGRGRPGFEASLSYPSCVEALFIILRSSLQTGLICTAAVPPHELFTAAPSSAHEQVELRVLMDDLDINEVSGDLFTSKHCCIDHMLSLSIACLQDVI